MELTNITNELMDSSNRLKSAGQQLFTLAREKAEAERTYRMALHQAIMQLRDQGERATLIPDMARGMTADQKYERDLAETRFTAGRETVDAIKTQVSALQTILKYQEEV